MKQTDYQRFLAFLYQQDCPIPFHAFRSREGNKPRRRSRVAERGAIFCRAASTYCRRASRYFDRLADRREGR